MSGLQHVRDQSRALLHRALSRRAVWHPCGAARTRVVACRVHARLGTFGDPKDRGYAERAETEPRLVFAARDVTPVRGDVFALTAEEVYRVDHVLPPDGITVTAVCVRLSVSERSNYVRDLPEADC